MNRRRILKITTTCILLIVVIRAFSLQMLVPHTTLNNISAYNRAEKNIIKLEECSKNSFQEPCRNGTVLHEKVNIKNITATETCPGMIFREQNNKDDTWHQVDKEKKIFVVSAYYIKSTNKVFIIGAKPMYDVSVICQIWTKSNDTADVNLWESKANVGSPNDIAGPLPYTAAIFNCPVNSTVTPTHVSLVTKSCEAARSILPVQVVPESSPFKRQFTVCMAPIYSYGNVHQLVEWIELNKILGVEKFVMYNYTTAVNVDHVINYYSKRGLADVIQWRLPFPILHHIHYFGQTVALNDCLFRNKHVSEYVSNIDKDEYIIPHYKGATNWSQLISNMKKYADVYMFRNVIFRKEWTGGSVNLTKIPEAESLRLLTRKHIERETKVYPTGDRSKYITRAAKVYYLWMHSVPRANVFTVPITEGLLHHYRSWEKYNDKNRRVVDLTIPEKYGDLLIRNVRSVWNDLAKLGVNMDIISDL